MQTFHQNQCARVCMVSRTQPRLINDLVRVKGTCKRRRTSPLATAAQATQIYPTPQEDASQRWKEEVDGDGWYQGCSNYLKELGIDNRAEIARILDIATNPKSLYHTHRDKKREGNSMARKLTAEGDLKPWVEFFQEQGLSKEEVVKVIIEYPAALCHNTSRLESFLKYLSDLGIKSPAKVVLQRPSLLGVDAEKGLAQIIEYLQANEYSIDQIEQLLATTL